MKSSMKHQEAKETPKQEADYHSRAFLQKAVKAKGFSKGKAKGFKK